MKRAQKGKKAIIPDQKENASSVCYSNSPEIRPEYQDEGQADHESNDKKLPDTDKR